MNILFASSLAGLSLSSQLLLVWVGGKSVIVISSPERQVGICLQDRVSSLADNPTQKNPWLWGKSFTSRSTFCLRSRWIRRMDASPKALCGMRSQSESRLTPVKAFELVSNVRLHVSERRNRWKRLSFVSVHLCSIYYSCCPSFHSVMPSYLLHPVLWFSFIFPFAFFCFSFFLLPPPQFPKNWGVFLLLYCQSCSFAPLSLQTPDSYCQKLQRTLISNHQSLLSR